MFKKVSGLVFIDKDGDHKNAAKFSRVVFVAGVRCDIVRKRRGLCHAF